jgi:hypothetical protein
VGAALVTCAPNLAGKSPRFPTSSDQQKLAHLLPNLAKTLIAVQTVTISNDSKQSCVHLRHITRFPLCRDAQVSRDEKQEIPSHAFPHQFAVSNVMSQNYLALGPKYTHTASETERS